jgi:hypothetical protein
MKNTIELKEPQNSFWSDVGIHSYCSNADIRKNHIRKNSYGLVGFHNSDLMVLGDSTAETSDSTQLIGDNTRAQCLFNTASFPTEIHWNVIRDTSQYSYQFHPFIKTVEYDELMQDTTGATEWYGSPYLDVIHNCWVNDTNPSDRLYPVRAYFWRNPWCPPDEGRQQKSEDISQSIYYQAYNDISDSNYAIAESEFKQVILEFPESKYAIASLKGLYALNSAIYNANYSTLKTYCDSLALNPGDSLLGKTAEWFSIRCNIKDHNYQQAVNSLDSILANPGTYADSIFALIDLSEVFTEISDTSALKSNLATRNPQVIPSSYKQHLVHRKEWVDLLLKPAESKYPGKITPPDKLDSSPPCKINSIHPNPAQTTFTVDYSIFQGGIYNLVLISSSGQVVITIIKGMMKPGNYVDFQNCAELTAGIYLVAITCNDIWIESNKLMVVN